MITEEVIKEIYKKFSKPGADKSASQLDRFLPILNQQHIVVADDKEVIVGDFDPMNPFHRFLRRSLSAILEFDKIIAFVFPNHILFFAKESPDVQVHFRPESDGGFLSKIFGRH